MSDLIANGSEKKELAVYMRPSVANSARRAGVVPLYLPLSYGHIPLAWKPPCHGYGRLGRAPALVAMWKNDWRKRNQESSRAPANLRTSDSRSHAARHHGEAAKHHEGGHHEKAAHHAHTARAHAIHARGHADEAMKAHAEEHGKK